jgi:pyridoxine/pyridoxamine 5'-phosphate oxidase
VNRGFAPDVLADEIRQRFDDPTQPAYGQLATVENQQAKVRTVHFRYFATENTIGFNTAVTSPKWIQLKDEPRHAGCFYDAEKRCQWRWEGRSVIVTESGNPALVLASWRQTREDLRALYWEQSTLSGENFSIETVCPDFGVVLLFPDFWDSYQMHETDYHHSARTLYKKEAESWRATAVSLVDSRQL